MSIHSKNQDIIIFINLFFKMAHLRSFARTSKVETGRRKVTFGEMRSKVGRIQY